MPRKRRFWNKCSLINLGALVKTRRIETSIYGFEVQLRWVLNAYVSASGGSFRSVTVQGSQSCNFYHAYMEEMTSKALLSSTILADFWLFIKWHLNSSPDYRNTYLYFSKRFWTCLTIIMPFYGFSVKFQNLDWVDKICSFLANMFLEIWIYAIDTDELWLLLCDQKFKWQRNENWSNRGSSDLQGKLRFMVPAYLIN